MNIEKSMNWVEEARKLAVRIRKQNWKIFSFDTETKSEVDSEHSEYEYLYHFERWASNSIEEFSAKCARLLAVDYDTIIYRRGVSNFYITGVIVCDDIRFKD